MQMAYEARRAYPGQRLHITNEIIHNPGGWGGGWQECPAGRCATPGRRRACPAPQRDRCLHRRAGTAAAPRCALSHWAAATRLLGSGQGTNTRVRPAPCRACAGRPSCPHPAPFSCRPAGVNQRLKEMDVQFIEVGPDGEKDFSGVKSGEVRAPAGKRPARRRPAPAQRQHPRNGHARQLRPGSSALLRPEQFRTGGMWWPPAMCTARRPTPPLQPPSPRHPSPPGSAGGHPARLWRERAGAAPAERPPGADRGHHLPLGQVRGRQGATCGRGVSHRGLLQPPPRASHGVCSQQIPLQGVLSAFPAS